LLNYVTDHDEMLKKLGNHVFSNELDFLKNKWCPCELLNSPSQKRSRPCIPHPRPRSYKSSHQQHDRHPFHRAKGCGYVVADDDTGYYYDENDEYYSQQWEDAGYDEYLGNDEPYSDDAPDGYMALT